MLHMNTSQALTVQKSRTLGMQKSNTCVFKPRFLKTGLYAVLGRVFKNAAQKNAALPPRVL